jgi:hypothetical protein
MPANCAGGCGCRNSPIVGSWERCRRGRTAPILGSWERWRRGRTAQEVVEAVRKSAFNTGFCFFGNNFYMVQV